MIAHVADALLRSPVRGVWVVAGADAGRLRAALGGRAVEFVSNPDPDGEMLGSIRCGRRALPPECGGFLIALGDELGLTTRLMVRLIEAFEAAGGAALCVPTCRGRRGHPVRCAARYREELLPRHDGVGLRGLLLVHAGAVVEVETGEPAVLEDLDTPQDYLRQTSSSAPSAWHQSNPGR